MKLNSLLLSLALFFGAAGFVVVGTGCISTADQTTEEADHANEEGEEGEEHADHSHEEGEEHADHSHEEGEEHTE